jgi:type I restriction enzyme S subunit
MNVPKLRFKDNNDNDYPNWVNSTIGKSGYFYYGKSAPKWSITDTATTPCVRYGELYTTHNIIVKKIYSYTNIPKENLKFSTGNEVLVPRVGEEPLDFCKCCYLPFKDVAIGEMISVYNTKNNPLFISYMFNGTMKYKFARLVEGGNVSNLYYSYLENISINLPCLEEQKKIANFLSTVDKKITNLENTITSLENQKKGLLQQIFSQKLRFKDKNGNNYPNWEKKKLGELIIIKTGISPTYILDENGSIPYFKVEQLNNSNKYQINTPYKTKNNKKLIPPKSIIFPKRGISILSNKIRILSQYSLIDTNIMALIIKNDSISNEFLYYFLLNEDLSKIADTTSIPQINNKHIEPYVIYLPCLEEQTKIADFLSAFDRKLENQKAQLEHWKQIKKGLLQQMFV